jgi:two-component system phosphate regulon sensor histidine kinase PhoR
MSTLTVRRFLWIAFLLLAASLVASGICVARFVERAQVDSLREQLTGTVRVLVAEPEASGESLDTWVKTAARRSGLRITAVDQDGVAVADSESVGETGAADRPEILGAVRAGIGSAIERDVRTNERFLYVAIPVHRAGSTATVLRLGKSLEPVYAMAAGLRYRLFGVELLSLALVSLPAIAFRHSFSRRTTLLKTYAEQLLDPDIADRDLPRGEDELGLLGQSLRRAAPRIRELVESLKTEAARREAILTSMVEGVLAVDKDLRVTFCNNSFARTVGARIPVMRGITLLELVRDPELLEIMTKVVSTGERVERRLKLAAAGAHSFDVLAGPLAGSAAPGALAIFHDVTELERLERVRKDFVANVSHELRTPLAAIRGYAETLLNGALEDRENNRRFVEVIDSQAMRLTNIASDLLTLSELESSEAVTAPHSVSVRAALGAALRTVESSARVRGVALRCEPIDDIRVTGQDLRLEQVFVNLLDNAVKFNRPNGEVRVDARVEGDRVCITVSDTGIGIPSEDLPRVFERFYRADKARSREMGGTGLGLSIVKHVVEQMGGTVTVESRLGEGCRFTIVVPESRSL